MSVMEFARSRMIEVRTNSPFIVRELLTRIGRKLPKEKCIVRQCFLFKRYQHYFISHFKHLMELNGLESTYGYRDKAFQYSTAKLLEGYGLLTVLPGQEDKEEPLIDSSYFLVLKKNASGWEIHDPYDPKTNTVNKRIIQSSRNSIHV